MFKEQIAMYKDHLDVVKRDDKITSLKQDNQNKLADAYGKMILISAENERLH